MTTYRLPEEIEQKVRELLKDYPTLEEKSKQLPWSLDDYMDGLIPQYGGIAVSPTNNISRKTENLAIAHVDKQREQRAAELQIKAIHDGIYQAARTCKNYRIGNKLRNVLTDNLVNGYSREDLGISPRTLTKYRKRAIYFIAIELGYYNPRNK